MQPDLMFSICPDDCVTNKESSLHHSIFTRMKLLPYGSQKIKPEVTYCIFLPLIVILFPLVLF